MEYADWMAEIDRLMVAEAGVTHNDLPDQPWRDWYDEGLEPEEAVENALDDAGFCN